MKRVISALFAAVAVLSLAGVLGGTGCATNASPQSQLDAANGLYAATLGEVDDLYQAGVIPAATYHNVITPARKDARKYLDRAKEQLAAGQLDQVKLLTQSATDVLTDLQQYRYKTKATTTKPVSGAAAGAIDIALLLLGLFSKYGPTLKQALDGKELTAEERAALDALVASETARADELDADATKNGLS